MKLFYAVMQNDCYAVRNDGSTLFILDPEIDVNPAYGFDSPQPDIQWIYEHCGIHVYRDYLFFYANYCIACFIADNYTSLNGGYTWITRDQLFSIDAEDELLAALLLAQNRVQSKTVPWMNGDGFSTYLTWAKSVLKEKGFTLCGAVRQIKNAYVSSIFQIPTDKGLVYLKISASVYVNNAAIEQRLTKDMGSVPVFIAVSPDGMASLTEEMSGEDCQSGSPEQYKRWLAEWGQQQTTTTGGNTYALTDCTPQKLLEDLPKFLNRVQKIYQTAGRPFSVQECEQLDNKLVTVHSALTALCSYPVPNTVCHADIRPGNVRIDANRERLYDWGMAFWGHPFYDAIHFLHVVRRQLTEEEHAEAVDAYLLQWLDYGDKQVLRNAYAAAESCKDFFMLAADCRWVAEIMNACGGIPQNGTMDNWLLSRRFYYFDRVLHRFIEE